MKTKTYHITNLGSFAPTHISESDGYVTYHQSKRYSAASDEQLDKWSDSRIKPVWSAAITEKAERALDHGLSTGWIEIYDDDPECGKSYQLAGL